MDDIESDVAQIRSACGRIRTMLDAHHGVRVKSKTINEQLGVQHTGGPNKGGGGKTRTIALNKKDARALMITLNELEALAEQTIKRISGIEDIVLEHLRGIVDDPSQAGAAIIDAIARKSDDAKLRSIGNDVGSAPGRRQSAVIIHSQY
jgi:hypothetical protein